MAVALLLLLLLLLLLPLLLLFLQLLPCRPPSTGLAAASTQPQAC
jgi:hypothetical protein